MTLMMTRRLLIAGGLASAGLPVWAAPRRYDLQAAGSTISFAFSVNGTAQTGTVPVTQADIRVDPQNLANSSADVTADIRAAKTGLIFVTQALLSAEVLDVQNHPNVRFVSNRIALGQNGRISEGARIDGALTLRGVTLPLQLDANLSRPAGTPPDDLSVLLVRLTGRLNRGDFGATGYPKLVAEPVDLDIRAEIRAST